MLTIFLAEKPGSTFFLFLSGISSTKVQTANS